MFFDGGNSVVGGSDKSYNQYSTVVTAELAKRSPATIGGVITFTSGISIDATVTNASSNDISGVKLMAVIYEDIGTSEHHYVVRDILQPIAIANLSPQNPQKFSLKSSLSSTSGLKAVLYLQTQSGEIIQSTLVIPRP